MNGTNYLQSIAIKIDFFSVALCEIAIAQRATKKAQSFTK